MRFVFVWQAILPAGGLSGRRIRYAKNGLGFSTAPWLFNEAAEGQAEALRRLKPSAG